MRFTELDKRTHEGYLRRVISPCEKLILYNYSDKCTFDRAWDEHTLKSRGTVYDRNSGEIVAHAFPKFFNYGEHTEERQLELLKEKNFKVYDKADGSLGIIYFYDGSWRVNTRGSFTSDQALKATEMLSKYQLCNMPKDMTFLAEIIYPENRIILDYGSEEKLVLLGCYQNGIDLDAELSDLGYHLDMEVARSFRFLNIQDLVDIKSKLPVSREGFVVRLKSGERIKFKGDDYLKVARILSGCSPLTFWESMSNGVVDRELLESIPEEFRSSFDDIKDSLEDSYDKILFEIHQTAGIIGNQIGVHSLSTFKDENKKDLGLYINSNEVEHGSAMFPLFLGNVAAIDKYILKTIRPKGNIL